MNAWPGNLALDDKLIVASGYFSGLSLFGALRFFTEDLWAVLSRNFRLYRPLLMVTIAMDAYIYGDWVAGFHLSNILLHLLVTLLVYGFIRHLLLVSGDHGFRCAPRAHRGRQLHFLVAFPAGSRAKVDELYAKAIAMGATDEGPAGERMPTFYGGYFRDPDGNKAVFYHMG